MDQQLKEKIENQGMDSQKIARQLEDFKRGFPFLPVVRPATIGDGMLKFGNTEVEHLVGLYDEMISQKEIVKFVPASGAASRMFKDLFAYLDEDEKEGAKKVFIEKFIAGLDSFGFRQALNKQLKKSGPSLGELKSAGQYHKIVRALLLEDGLNYGNLPKGLLHFHAYKNFVRTPTEEHFVEGNAYAHGKGGAVRLHFTVSPEHQAAFDEHCSGILTSDEYKNAEVTFSTQKKSTDTIAVNMDNTPFEETDGSLLFRPAGHGALLDNLNAIDADIIFIKNIDNVVPDRIKEETIKYKKVLGGLLLKLQAQLFVYQKMLDQGTDDSHLPKIKAFASDELGIKFADDFDLLPSSGKVEVLKEKLFRPLRICGMVKNTGEPGGGPFWVKEPDGGASLQISETSQLDLENKEIADLLASATHFNPVDLVCAVKDYKGDKYNLLDFRDPNTGFITYKSKDGKELKAMELPGLWNGAMANWITLFVEVPLITFNPVKTVNDLLRDQHQA